MFRLPRASVLLLLLAISFAVNTWSATPNAFGFQVPDVTGPGVWVDAPGNGDSIKPTDPVTLPIDRSARKKLVTARDYVKEESWSEAVRLIQAILDAPEDGFLPRSTTAKAAGDKKSGPRWVSARAEAERMLVELPPNGLEFYQLSFDATARKLLTAAQARQDVQAVGEVVRRFALTKAGGEALASLGTYHLDRGRPDLAAGCFHRLLSRPGAENLPVPILYQTALAFHAVGDAAHEGRAWGMLLKRVGPEGYASAARSSPSRGCAKRLNAGRAHRGVRATGRFTGVTLAAPPPDRASRL